GGPLVLAVAAEVADTQTPAPVTPGLTLSPRMSAVVDVDGAVAASVLAALPTGAHAVTITDEDATLSTSGFSDATPVLTTVRPDGHTWIGPEPEISNEPESARRLVAAASLASAGPVSSDTAVTFSLRTFSFQVSYLAAGGATRRSLGYTCQPAGDATIGSWPVLASTPPTPTPTPKPPTIDTHIVSSATGSATLRTLVKGSAPMSGTLEYHVGLRTGTLSQASLTLGDTSANLVVLGTLPVRAKLGFTATEPVTGTLASGVLTLTTKQRLKVTAMSIFGVSLIAGSTCQASQPSTIQLKSTGLYAPLSGGTVAGSFAISNLSGCGGLTGIVSALTAGTANTMVLDLKTTTGSI
ncbi:MAG: hypothetical protein AAGC46_18815, partial [Solirubrobacteraceae bacterium]